MTQHYLSVDVGLDDVMTVSTIVVHHMPDGHHVSEVVRVERHPRNGEHVCKCSVCKKKAEPKPERATKPQQWENHLLGQFIPPEPSSFARMSEEVNRRELEMRMRYGVPMMRYPMSYGDLGPEHAVAVPAAAPVQFDEEAFNRSMKQLDERVVAQRKEMEEYNKKKAAELRVKLKAHKMTLKESGPSAVAMAEPARPRTMVYCQSQYDPDEP